MSGPSQVERTQSRSLSVMVGSNSAFIISATVPSHRSRLANRSGSVVRKLTHQFGCIAPSSTVFADNAGGMLKPLRTSRSRTPATGTSTVRTSASNPAAFARAIRSSAGAWSRQT